MKKNLLDIFPIAIGTFGLGADRNESWQDNNCESIEIDQEAMNALLYSYERGQNYIETSSIYAGGKTLRFVSEFLKKVDRNRLFITIKIENFVERKEDIENQLNKYLSILGLEQADSILLHTPAVSKISLEESYLELKRLKKLGKSRYLSASNLNLVQLKQLVEDLRLDLFGFEGLYNLECKFNEDEGIITYCREHGIKFINYQPFRRNRTANRNYPVLVDLVKKYGKEQNQILLNWYVYEKQITPITKADKKEHIDLNLSALDFKMENDDYKKLNEFRSGEFDSLGVDWNDNGGVPIWKIANQLD